MGRGWVGAEGQEEQTSPEVEGDCHRAVETLDYI